jgi:hypothetical protein
LLRQIQRSLAGFDWSWLALASQFVGGDLILLDTHIAFLLRISFRINLSVISSVFRRKLDVQFA